VAADYTRNIVFNVNDKAIKRATDRITRSLTNIEKTLQRIERKGFNNLAKSAETASKQITNTNKNVAIAQKRIQLLGNAGKEIGGVYQRSFGKVFSTFDKLLPIVSETKETIRVLSRNAKRDIDLITFATKASGQGISKLVELFKQGQVSAMTFVTGVSAILSKTKEFGSVAITNLTTLGRLIEENTKKAGTLVNVLGFKTGIISQPLNLFQNTQAAFERNTLLARQNATRGNVVRNIQRSQAARRGSDFLDFSRDADFVTRVMNSRGRPPAFRFGVAGGLIGPEDMPGVQDPTAKAIRRNERKTNKFLQRIAKSTAKSAQLQQQQVAQQNFAGQTPSIPSAQQRLSAAERLGIGRRANPRGIFASRSGVSGRVKSGLQSGLIGGGFPLLFGQGGIGAVAGGIGGLAGGALSPGFGFAGSIVATAAAQEIQKVLDFRKAVKDLNVELKNQGITTQITRKQIKQLAKDLKISKEEALKLTKEFGKFQDVGGLNLLRIFGDRATFDATVGLNDFSNTLNRIQTLSEKLTLEKEFKAFEILSTKGSEAANEFIINSLLASEQSKKFAGRFEKDMKKFEDVGVSAIRGVFGKLNDLQIQTFLNQDFQEIVKEIMKSDEQIRSIMNNPQNTKEGLISVDAKNKIDARLKEIFADTLLLQQALDKLPEKFDLSTVSAKQLVDALSENVEKLQFLAEFQAPTEELNKMLNPMRQVLDLSVAIKNGFEESFKGIIKGTMSVGDAFRNMLNRIADHFLDTAARMAALQVQKGFLGLFSSMFKISSNSIPSIGSNNVGDVLQNSFDLPKDKFANGGRPPVGRASLVGERGPELFVPDRSGTIIPNNQLGGMAGAMNVIVNVDASGSSVEGDEQNGRELGLVLSAAIESELIKQKRPGGLLA